MMPYLFSILAVLVIGMIIMMTGILMTKEPQQSLQSSFNESLAWGVGFFLSFGAEAFMFANV